MQPLVGEFRQLVLALHSASHGDYTDVEFGFEGSELQPGSYK